MVAIYFSSGNQQELQTSYVYGQPLINIEFFQIVLSFRDRAETKPHIFQKKRKFCIQPIFPTIFAKLCKLFISNTSNNLLTILGLF